jgi:hypothetical protein
MKRIDGIEGLIIEDLIKFEKGGVSGSPAATSNL